MRNRLAIRALVCRTAVALSILAGCGRGPAAPAMPGPQTSPTAEAFPRVPERVDAPHLPNAWRLHERVISGGLPEGEAAFEELRKLGVKTVVSVDGAKPDVELARKYGLRYVHLPHGYDGIPESRERELAKAVRDLPGPIYIHCHHGKHRSPAAATVACISVGLLEPADALAVLKTAGTSDRYRGLYQSAEEARRIDDKRLDALNAEFPEVARIPPMAEAMVAIEHTFDHLKELAESGWGSSKAHPDLDAAHEALLLREHFTELLRTEDTRSRSEAFQQMLKDSEADAETLEKLLFSKPDADVAAKAFERIAEACGKCHRDFRDIPLRQK